MIPSCRDRRGTGGFTLTELLVAVTIMAVMAGLLLPAFARAQHSREKAVCTSNLHTIYGGIALYIADHDGYFPAPQTADNVCWFMYINPYLFPGEAATWAAAAPHAALYSCPANTRYIRAALKKTFPFNYGMNHCLGPFTGGSAIYRKLLSIPQPTQTLLVSESGYSTTTPSAELDSYWYPLSATFKGQYIGGVHDGANNLLWCDGHISLQADIKSIIPVQAGTVNDHLFAPGFNPGLP